MATINLGNIKFNWKGAYAGGTAYVIDDVVSYSGSSYICKLASTGNLPTNATYWEQMSAAGTDLTSTLTTEGDVLFRDGSGLQRLAKGTAAQQLAMNAGATAPEWITAGGGGSFALQEYKTVGTSAVGSVTFDNLVPFYDYLFTWNAIDSTATSTEDFYMQVSPDGGSTWRTSGYKSGLWVSRSDGTTNGTNTTSGYYISYNQASSYVYNGNNGHCYLQNIDANCKTVMHGQNIVMGQTDRSELSMIGGFYDTVEVTDMVRFLFSSGNISGATAPATGNIACYKQVIA